MTADNARTEDATRAVHQALNCDRGEYDDHAGGGHACFEHETDLDSDGHCPVAKTIAQTLADAGLLANPHHPKGPIMTTNERLAEIKADLSEICDTWELSQSEIAEISDTAAALVAALEAVLELHRRGHPVVSRDDMCLDCRDEFGALVPYPCPTVEAVSEALGVGQ